MQNGDAREIQKRQLFLGYFCLLLFGKVCNSIKALIQKSQCQLASRPGLNSRGSLKDGWILHRKDSKYSLVAYAVPSEE